MNHFDAGQDGCGTGHRLATKHEGVDQQVDDEDRDEGEGVLGDIDEPRLGDGDERQHGHRRCDGIAALGEKRGSEFLISVYAGVAFL